VRVAGLLALGAALLTVLLPSPASAAETAPKTVFMLWGGRPDLFANADVDRIIRARLAQEFGSDVDIYTEHVDTFRNAEEERLALRDFIRRKYAGKQFDIVIAIADQAAAFLRRHGEELFPDVPMVSWAGREEFAPAPDARPPMAVAFIKSDLPGALEFILQLQPETRQVIVIGGAAPRDKPLLATARSHLARFESRVALQYLVGLPVEELEARLSHLPPQVAILWLSMTLDNDGRRVINREALAHIAKTANVPVYALAASHLGTGIVGGWVADQAALSEATADIAVQVLRGARVQDIPVRQLTPVPMVDWRAVRRWGIAEGRLPAGTIVRYREPTMWDAYKWRIVGAAALCVAEALLIVALLVQGERRRRAEKVADELRRELTHLSRVETMGALSGALAHELNQPLTAILANAQAARRFLAMQPPRIEDVREALEDIMMDDERAGHVIQRLRGMLKRTETQTQIVDLNDAIRDVLDLARGDLISRGVSVSAELQAGLPPVIGDRVQIQQVLLNLILNGCDAMAAVDRERRSLTVVTGTTDTGGAGFAVVDHGTGIASAEMDKIFQPFVTTKQNGLGLGLAICQTIIGAHGGKLWATNNADAGATLHVALPSASSSSGDTHPH
jgi:signal transduction histidine kinase